jgi:hypothetical protein
VKLRSFVEAWNTFFFTPQSPTPIALFRILYGIMVVATLLLLRPDWLAWYGPHSWVTLDTMRGLEPGPRLNLFVILPQSNAWINALFWVSLASALLLTVGFLTRLNSILVFLFLASIDQRNLEITHGGDTFLRVAGFFLMFAPAGAAFSVDRLIRIWRGKESAQLEPKSPWAQRMIQFEMALLYFVSFCWKIQGGAWVKGTALYYVYHLDEIQRFPVPQWFLRPTLLKLGTWWALVLEFALGTLIWIKELRYTILALGLIFHLFIEYSLNLPMFEWDVLTAYILFVDPEDLSGAWNWIRTRVTAHLGEPTTVFYDGKSERPRRTAELLRALDIFHRLKLTDLRASETPPGIPQAADRNRLLVQTPTGISQGHEVLRALAPAVPILWPLALPEMFRRAAHPARNASR